MGNARFNINGTWKNIKEWYIRTDPTAPVLEFDGSNEPKDFDPDIKSHIQTNGNVTDYDFTDIPQGNTILLPEFTLTDKFKIEFRIYGKSTTNNEVACIFSTQHDRQGAFSDSVFAMYPPTINDGFPSDACAIHVVPKDDPAAQPHQQFIVTNGGTTVTQQARFGGRRVVFRGLFDDAWHNVRVEYDGSTSSNASLKVFLDNDDGNFVQKDLYRNSSTMTAGTNKQTTVPHGSGFTASHSARLMSSYAYFTSYINANGFNSHNNSTPRFNAHAGKLGNFKLTLYPNGAEQVFFDFKIKDGVQDTTKQIIRDSGGFNNDAELIKASDVNFSDLWDYGDGTTDSWKQIEKAFVKINGNWKCFFSGKILLSITGVVSDYDLFTEAGSPTEAVDIELIINGGAIVYSTTTSHGAIYCSTNLPTGSTVNIVNRGFVYGKGGDGGNCPYFTGRLEAKNVDLNNCEGSGGNGMTDVNGAPFILDSGGSRTDVTAGENGGAALELGCNTTLTNFGQFYGGGGGAGANRIWNIGYVGSGSFRVYRIDAQVAGGGGAGYIPGEGGIIVKKSASFDWSKPPHEGNNNGASFGAGDASTIRAFSGTRTHGGQGLYGTCKNDSVAGLYITSQNNGGRLNQDGSNRQTSNYYVSNGYGILYEITAANGRRGAGIDTKGFTLTYNPDNYRVVNNTFDTVTGVGVPVPVSIGTPPVKKPRKKRDKIWGTCVLGTACYFQDLITEDELMSLVRWRMKEQKKSFQSEQIWLGYMIGYRSLAAMMLKNELLSKIIYKLIVRDWVKKSKGQCNMFIRSFFICSYALIIYYLKPNECMKLQSQLPKTAKGVLKFYKKVIASKDF